MQKFYTDLFRHTNWADATVWRAVLQVTSAENDTRLRDLLYHIHTVQHAFLRIWTKQTMDFPEVSSFQNLTAIASWGYQYHQDVLSYLDKIEESFLQRPVTIPWAEHIEKIFGKSPKTTTLAETMLQVALHTMHHRGQVNARLREIGEEPPLIDFIAWVWFGKPQADWPNNIKP